MKKEVWYMQTVEYYSVLKVNKVAIHATADEPWKCYDK